jgi:hypothetical protein
VVAAVTGPTHGVLASHNPDLGVVLILALALLVLEAPEVLLQKHQTLLVPAALELELGPEGLKVLVALLVQVGGLEHAPHWLSILLVVEPGQQGGER